MRCSNCNETDHEPTAKFCHVCGQKFASASSESSRNYIEQSRRLTGDLGRKIRDAQNDADDYYVPKWIKILRWSLLFIIFVWYVLISIEEVKIDLPGEPWGSVTVGFVNFFSFIITLSLCILANKGDFVDKRLGWRWYYEWIHFAAAAFIPYVGYGIATIHNGWVLLLNGILVALMILISFGTLETIISD